MGQKTVESSLGLILRWGSLNAIIAALALVILPSFFCDAYAGAKGTSWIKSLEKGDNVTAAHQLARSMLKLDPKELEESSFQLLTDLGLMLEKDAVICPESSKVTVFRGTKIGKIDRLRGPKKIPLFLSRVLRNPNSSSLRSNGISYVARDYLLDLLEMHSLSKRRDESPFISATYHVGTATNMSLDVVVLRICPQRLIKPKEYYGGEFEVVVPLLIHPSEVVAILRQTNYNVTNSVDYNLILKDEFEFIGRYGKFAKMNESKAITELKKLASTAEKHRWNFWKHLERQRNKKGVKTREQLARRSCIGIFKSLGFFATPPMLMEVFSKWRPCEDLATAIQCYVGK